MESITYTNIIGTFEFKDRKLVKEKLFSDKELEGALSKTGEAKTELPPDWVLEHLNKPKYLVRLREAALLLTKQKIKASLRPEHLIIQAVNNTEEIDRAANGLAKRAREWYELYNPEFSRSIESHEKFVELIQQKTKKQLLSEAGVAEGESMGADIGKKDLAPLMALAKEIESMYALREAQKEYIETAMKEHLPNVTAVSGSMIGAKLLAVAGSLEKMAMLPASTIQLLGAEKALFRHLTTGAKPPKFGVIINHPLVTSAKQKEKGRAARMLADKISIAAKIDFFKGEFRGDALRKELEKRLGR
ncbi:NOP58 family protein [Candidatus Woesearchaeota archaeon]|nr:NOP58 family protein [Candidatus Woesearchaeota archaeon]